jgi:uncharacterized protein (TIGR01777 family)
MRVFVTGGTGFIGARLVPFLREKGHQALLLVRPQERKGPIPEGVEVVEGDPSAAGPWWGPVAECDAAVNMAGASIFGRWNDERKRVIRESRLATTRHLVDAIPQGRPFTLVSTSAVGIYGDAGERELDESAPLGGDFLALLAQDWETEARRAAEKGARVVITRFAIVLGAGGGALEQLARVGRLGLAGPVGSGRQWFSWIHREDLVRAILFLLERTEHQGVFNLSSPKPRRQGEVARAIGEVLHRPAILPAPAFAVRLALGEFADAVLFSQRMVPRRLTDAGFDFRFPELEETLREILG